MILFRFHSVHSGLPDEGLLLRHIHSYRVVLESMNTSLALFQFNGIGREILIKQPMTIEMEIASFLTDRCCGQNERMKRGVESAVHIVRALHRSDEITGFSGG